MVFACAKILVNVSLNVLIKKGVPLKDALFTNNYYELGLKTVNTQRFLIKSLTKIFIWYVIKPLHRVVYSLLSEL